MMNQLAPSVCQVEDLIGRVKLGSAAPAGEAAQAAQVSRAGYLQDVKKALRDDARQVLAAADQHHITAAQAAIDLILAYLLERPWLTVPPKDAPAGQGTKRTRAEAASSSGAASSIAGGSGRQPDATPPLDEEAESSQNTRPRTEALSASPSWLRLGGFVSRWW
jgi:ElaB/YqjD/DUF883 family membrane-anchored ribosome-binding protein